MTTQKQTLLITFFVFAAFQIFGQVTVVKKHNPAGSAAKPQTYSTEQETSAPQPDAATRRAAALSKVQGAPTKSMTAKGTAPAQYSTEDEEPETYSAPNPSTTMTVNGLNVQRSVRKGKGQVGDRIFTPVSELYFVQFAVYCKNTPVDKAPPIEGLMLLWHEGSRCPGGAEGACYIVKGYSTPDEAKAAVLQFKSHEIDCWYNPALTGAEVEVIGIR